MIRNRCPLFFGISHLSYSDPILHDGIETAASLAGSGVSATLHSVLRPGQAGLQRTDKLGGNTRSPYGLLLGRSTTSLPGSANSVSTSWTRESVPEFRCTILEPPSWCFLASELPFICWQPAAADFVAVLGSLLHRMSWVGSTPLKMVRKEQA